MDPKILYWYWLIFGMLLIISRIVHPQFHHLLVRAGRSARVPVLWLIPDMALAWQILVWALASSLFTVLWFRYFKRFMPDRTKAGISREAIQGESGQVIKVPQDNLHGVVRFTTPLLGADEWPFICTETVAPGDRVFVKDISGNTLVVEKRN